MKEKAVIWFHGEVKTPPFSAAARREAGGLLGLLQQGDIIGLPASRPMPSIGTRCHELRINDDDQTWRIVCRIDPDAIVVLEAFGQEDQDDLEEGHRRLQGAHQELRESAEGVTMDKAKERKLRAAGWEVGAAQDFPEMDDTEAALVAIRVSLAGSIRARRKAAGLTQAEVAKMASTTQARVAKAENASQEGVSLDLAMRILLALGASPKKIAKAIAA